MSEWSSFLFGLLQGLTEFLPISSSGHLFLLEQFLNINQDSLSFIILLHGATVLSVLTVFFKEIKSFVFSLNTKPSQKVFLNIVISSIPVAIVGLFFKHLVEKSFILPVVGMGFLLTGLLLLSLFFKKPKPLEGGLKDLSFFKAFLIGLFQALSVLPGFSRSGWTVSAGLYLGLSSRSSVYYSFLIALPAILGSSGINLIENFHTLDFSLSLLFSFLVAYLSGTAALLLILKMVQKNRFYAFSFYLLPLSFYLILFL